MKYLNADEISTELSRVTYKPGFEFSCCTHPFEDVFVRIEFDVPDTYHPGKTQRQCVNVPVPPIVDTEHFHDWLMWRLKTIELHELCEFYKVGGFIQFDPHTEAYWSIVS